MYFLKFFTSEGDMFPVNDGERTRAHMHTHTYTNIYIMKANSKAHINGKQFIHGQFSRQIRSTESKQALLAEPSVGSILRRIQCYI